MKALGFVVCLVQQKPCSDDIGAYNGRVKQERYILFKNLNNFRNMFGFGLFLKQFLILFYFILIHRILLRKLLSSVKGDDRPGFEAEILLLKVGLSPQAVCHKHIKA